MFVAESSCLLLLRFHTQCWAKKGDFVIKKATEDVSVGRGVGVDVHQEKQCH